MGITSVQGSSRWMPPVKETALGKGRAEPAVCPSRDKVELGKGPEAERMTYAPPKKLDGKTVRAMEAEQSRQKLELLQAMASNALTQANHWLKTKGEAGGADLSRFGLPPLAADPAGAQAAIAPGGAYSVDAVATRIFDMACHLAGDDPEKLEEMRAAVIKGFEAAGASFSEAMGTGLPDICNETYREIMDRFDQRVQELGGEA